MGNIILKEGLCRGNRPGPYYNMYNNYGTVYNIIVVQRVGLASLAHSLFVNFETVVSTGWRAGIDCKRAGWRSGRGRGDMCGPCTY